MSTALALVLVAVNAVAYRHARAFLRFGGSEEKTRNPEELATADKLAVLLRGIHNPRPRDDASPRDYGLACEVVSITVTEGVQLGGWLARKGKGAPCAVLFHGFTASKSSLLGEARSLFDRGYAVLCVDFRGSGDSSESHTTVGYEEADDVAAAVTYARQELAPSRLVLLGKSMGAAAVLRALFVHELAVDAVILEGVFDRMLTTVAQRFVTMGLPPTPLAQLLVFWGGVQQRFWAFSHNPVEYAARCRVPTLMLHGEHDPRATLAQARSVFEALATQDKAFVPFDGAGHEPLLQHDPAQWNAAVDAFLGKLAAP